LASRLFAVGDDDSSTKAVSTKLPIFKILSLSGAGCFLLVGTGFAQKLEIVSSRPAPEAEGSSFPTGLVILVALLFGGILAWVIRGKIKFVGPSGPQIPSRPPVKKPARPQAKVQAVVDETRTRDRVLSQLNAVVEETKNDTRYLPVFKLKEIPAPPELDALAASDDPRLQAAILQSNEEEEPDAAVREAAIQILSEICTADSIDALSQVAKYDPSASLRALALATLASFDHGSVFEPIIIASADPSREVRAAASKALSKLTFSRTNEWLRIAGSDDMFTISQCARAMGGSGLVPSIIERVANRERQSALEAIAIVCVLLRAGESADIVEAVLNHNNPNISRALLHIIDILDDRNTIDELERAVETFEIRDDFRPEVERVLSRRNTPAPTNGYRGSQSPQAVTDL